MLFQKKKLTVTSCVLGVWRPALLLQPERDEQLWVGEGHGDPGPGGKELRNSILRNYALSLLKCKSRGLPWWSSG